MSREVVGVAPGASLREVARVLLEHGISGVPVLSDEGKVLGVVSEGDVLVKAGASLGREEHAANWLFGDDEGLRLKRRAQTAAEAMSRPAITVDPHCTVAEAARLMVRRSVNRLPVVDDGRLVGIVTRTDVVRAFARPDSELLEQIRSEVLLETLWIDPVSVDVTVEEGEVTVTGEVETRTVADLVPVYVSLVPGVLSVDVSRLAWHTDTRAAAPRVPTLTRGLMWNAERLWLVAETRRISAGSGLPVASATRCARPVRPPRSQPSPQASNPTSNL